MKTKGMTNSQTTLKKLALLSVVGLGLGIASSPANAAITVSQGLSTVYLPVFSTPGLEYAMVDGTSSVVGGVDLILAVGATSDLTIGETIIISCPSGFQFDATDGNYTLTDSGTGASVTLAATASAVTLTAGANASSTGNLTISVFPMAVSDGTTAAVSATAMANISGTANVTGASPGTLQGVAGPSIVFTTPASAGDSTDLADGDGGAEYTAAFAITENTNHATATYSFWWSEDPNLVNIEYDEGAQQAIDDSDADITSMTDATTSQVIGTQYLPSYEKDGVQWYLYLTSTASGTMTCGSAGPVRVFHYPTNGYSPVSDAAVADVDPSSDTYLDSGGLLAASGGSEDGTGVDNDDIDFVTIDYDHNAYVQLYYSTVATLTESDLVLTGTSPNEVVSSLTGATLIASSDTLREDTDTDFNWDIYTSDTNYITAGSYYIYIVSNDGINQDVDASTNVYIVTHSPRLTLADAVSGYTDDLYPNINRYYTVNWGTTINGDIDPDDSATIDIYIDCSTDGNADFNQSTISTLTSTSTRSDDDATNGELIVSGLSEDNDGQLRNLYDIDLWGLSETLRASINTRIAAGDNLHVYAVITGGSQSRLAAIGDGSDDVVSSTEDITDLSVTNSPDAMLCDPPALGGNVTWGETYRLTWDFIWDFGESTQNILFYLGNSSSTASVWGGGSGLSDVVDHLWCMNSTDGTVANNSGSTNEKTGLSYDGYFDFYPERMTGNSVGATGGSALSTVGNGTYYVYAVLSSNAAGSAAANTNTVWKFPGSLTINGISSTQPPDLGYEMVPSNISMAKHDTVTFSIYPNAWVATAEIAALYMRVDTTYFGIVSPSSPFSLNTTNFTSSGVVENDNHGGATSEGYYLLDFVYHDASGSSNLNGGTHELCTLQLYCKGAVGNQGGGTSAYIWFDSNENGERNCQFYDGNGDPIYATVMSPACDVTVYPLGELQGNVDLEGPDDFDVTATLNLRPSGAQHGLDYWNSSFLSANDADATTEGLQVVLDAEGHFHLNDVPNGEYDLTAHVDGWLNGTVDVQVMHNEHDGDMDPHYTDPNNSNGTNRLQLLAGDCAGYTDSSAVTRPDNQVDATDVSAVTTAYGSTSDSTDWNAYCDFDRDASIDLDDLNLCNGNVGTSGVWIVYRTGQDNSSAEYMFTGVPEEVRTGDVFDLNILVRNVNDVRAYEVGTSYDKQMLRLISVQQTDYLANATRFQKFWGDEVVCVASMQGRDLPGSAGSGILATLRFEATQNGEPAFMFSRGMVINSEGESTVPAFRNAGVVPDNFELHQNFPNPFNPVTNISFLLPTDELVNLAVYNVLGQKVATIVEQPMQAGVYQFNWNGTSQSGQRVASGVYFYRLDAGKYHASRKMMLLK